MEFTIEQLQKLSGLIRADINDYCVRSFDGGHRRHLGGSIIGKPCARELWYTFRWVRHVVHSGRLYRLFNRGHLEELRIVQWLRGCGFNVSEFSDDTNKTQYRISGVNGHFGGSLDGVAELPDSYKALTGGAALPPMLLEFKTSGTGAAFNDLAKIGVRRAKPLHFDQMSTYGRKHGLKYALYICVNKNDDDIHVEVVKLDWKRAEALEQRAAEIINSLTPPPRYDANSAHSMCRYCDFAAICHDNAAYEKNCRNCANVRPVANGEWECRHYGVIPEEAIKTLFASRGCSAYREAR